MIRLSIALSTALLPFVAFAQTENPALMGATEAEKIEAVVKASNRDLSLSTGKDGSFMVELNARWLKKCDDVKGDARRQCALTECDFKEQFKTNCRNDNILIFRGENRAKPFPSVAALARSHMRGSDFLQSVPDAKDPAGVSNALLSQLAKETLKFGRMQDVPSSFVFLSTGKAGRTWFSIDEDANKPVAIKPTNEKNPHGAALLVYGIHVIGNPYGYLQKDIMQFPSPLEDIKTEGSAIDPLVSYSYGVGIPMHFGSPEKEGDFGRVIVISIKRKSILRNCPKFGENKFNAPGTIWDASHCPISQATQFPESEIDAIMYPNADDIVGSFLIPFGLEVDLGSHFAG